MNSPETKEIVDRDPAILRASRSPIASAIPSGVPTQNDPKLSKMPL